MRGSWAETETKTEVREMQSLSEVKDCCVLTHGRGEGGASSCSELAAALSCFGPLRKKRDIWPN